MAGDQRPCLTDPGYISQQMFDKVIREKFQANRDDAAVRNQAAKLILLLHASKCREQVISDVLQAATTSGKNSAEWIAEIAFAMGLQFGFELGLSYPPL